MLELDEFVEARELIAEELNDNRLLSALARVLLLQITYTSIHNRT